MKNKKYIHTSEELNACVQSFETEKDFRKSFNDNTVNIILNYVEHFNELLKNDKITVSNFISLMVSYSADVLDYLLQSTVALAGILPAVGYRSSIYDTIIKAQAPLTVYTTRKMQTIDYIKLAKLQDENLTQSIQDEASSED